VDPRRNPYAPGAGTPPPELAARDDMIERTAIALDRIRAGRAARSVIFHGLRGVGKTVLLNRIRLDAEARGLASTRIEAPEDRSLPALLAPALRAALFRLRRIEATKAGLQKAMRALAGFASALKMKFQDIEVDLDLDPEKGLADSGPRHRSGGSYDGGRRGCGGARHRRRVVCRRAAIRVDRLDTVAASAALCVPSRKEGVEFSDRAIEVVLDHTLGYPYFLQEWGKHTWNVAEASPIGYDDARRATDEAVAELDAGFFRVRFDRLTPAEKRYLRAMAELGAGPHRSGDIADRMGRKVTTVAPIRSALIAKGML
jgi:hypothetical protein